MPESKNRDTEHLPGEDREKKPERNRYQLRRAAGLCWLLDMEQSGVPYVKPVPINEMGADIWKLYVQGFSAEEIAERLGRAYDVPTGQVKEDVRVFLKGLKEQGVMLQQFRK